MHGKGPNGGVPPAPDMLVRAKLPPVDRRRGEGRGPHRGFERCGKKNCMCCIYSKETSATEDTWPIKQSICCGDNNVLYSVTYLHQTESARTAPNTWVMVGSTRPCRDRFTEHRGAVRNNHDMAVREHFNLPGHSLDDFSFLAFEKVRNKDPFVIEAREHYWIKKCQALDQGLNRLNRRTRFSPVGQQVFLLPNLHCSFTTNLNNISFEYGNQSNHTLHPP